VHGFRCYDNVYTYVSLSLYTTNAYSGERKMPASAGTRSVPGLDYSPVDLEGFLPRRATCCTEGEI